MYQSKISVRYATALFLYAEEKGILDLIRNDMTLIYDTYSISDFPLFLETPTVKPSQKELFFSKVFDKKIQPDTFSFLSLILKNRREKYLKLICRNYIELYKKDKGIKTVSFISASSVDAQTRKEIIEIVKKIYDSEIDLNESVDTNIIGGFILRMDNKQLDYSIRSKLIQLKQELINTSLEENI